MDVRTVASGRAPKAIGPYSQAIVGGDLVFCSGQVGLDPATGQVVGGGIAAETRQVLENLRHVLEAAGASPGSVLKTTVFLADLADFEAMNAVYAEFFGEHRPARSTVQVARLPRGGRVEIDATAVAR